VNPCVDPSGAACGAGYSLTECLLAVATAGALAALSVPAAASVAEAARCRQDAATVAARFRLARQRAVTASAAVALVFDRQGGRWAMTLCVDGNGNGVRRAELGGADVCPDPPLELDVTLGALRVGVDPAIPDPAGQAGSADPVRFGPSDVAAFTPAGTATPGTLYLRALDGTQFAIRVAGATGRTRVLLFDRRQGAWVVP
jgi:hypothetical protein